MFKSIILILIGLGVGLGGTWLIKRRIRKLPFICDDLFLEKFNTIFSGIPDEIVLQERKNLANQLGISYKKLDPYYTFDELSKYLNFLGSYDLAIGDLEENVSDLFERLGVKKPYKSPSTVGELIYEIAKAKLTHSSCKLG